MDENEKSQLQMLLGFEDANDQQQAKNEDNLKSDFPNLDEMMLPH